MYPVNFPAASEATLTAMSTGLQFPLRVVQARSGPMVADSHDAEALAVRFSVPSPELKASTVWAGPTDAALSTSRGAALNKGGTNRKRTAGDFQFRRYR